MLRFEELLADFTNTVNILDFVINIVVATILSLIIKWFYIQFATSFSNREKFAAILIPMALTTLLIITVVQASIALSLGLVGALSIVRFRAAIKEPEELTFIFLVIAVGLTCGANKSLLAILAIALILPLIYLNTKMNGKRVMTKDNMVINVKSSTLDVASIIKAMESQFDFIELKRATSNKNEVYVTVLAKLNNINDINSVNKALKDADADVDISIVNQPELVL